MQHDCPYCGRDLTAVLTARETEVLVLIAQGITTNGIALRLGISHRTVDNHVASLMNRLGAVSRSHAIAIAASRGILSRLPTIE